MYQLPQQTVCSGPADLPVINGQQNEPQGEHQVMRMSPAYEIDTSKNPSVKDKHDTEENMQHCEGPFQAERNRR